MLHKEEDKRGNMGLNGPSVLDKDINLWDFRSRRCAYCWSLGPDLAQTSLFSLLALKPTTIIKISTEIEHH